MGSNSLHNSHNGYQNSRQSECFSQTRNGYNHADQTKERLVKHQVYNTQRTLGNDNGIAVWPEKDRFTASSDKMQTFDLNSYFRQDKADPRTSKLYQPNALSQSATMPVVDKTNSFTQLLNTDSAMKDKEAVPNYWPWCGTSLSGYQNQQHLSNIHQTYPTKQISRDPRLMNKSESFTGNGAFISNKGPVGHGNVQEQVSETDGYRRQREEKNTKRYREETEHSFLEGTTTATWWNVSPMSQYPKPANPPTINTERSAPAVRMEKNNSVNVTGDKWKGLRTWGKQPMQLTLKELSNKRNTNDAFFQGTDSHKTNPWNHPSLTGPRVKTCRITSAAELQNGTKWTPKELENGSKNKRRMGDLESFQNRNSLQDKPQLRIHPKENDQDAKSLEICAREERIRKLKSLLIQHEQALEALRFQRNSPSSDETNGNFVNIINNETLNQKPSDQENRSEEEYCSSSDAILGKSLKRRWLKNWNEEDELEHIEPPEKIVKREEIHSHGTLSEDGNQNLSNAEFTALEGLVKLSKD